MKIKVRAKEGVISVRTPLNKNKLQTDSQSKLYFQKTSFIVKDVLYVPCE
jgi:hypothetical protein